MFTRINSEFGLIRYGEQLDNIVNKMNDAEREADRHGNVGDIHGDAHGRGELFKLHGVADKFEAAIDEDADDDDTDEIE